MTASPSKARTLKRHLKHENFEWRGVTVAVSYEPDWLGSSKRGTRSATAHLEIRAVTPDGAKLPITGTGYLSHFLEPGLVEERGGPAAYVHAWLDWAAKGKAWRAYELASRQLSLF